MRGTTPQFIAFDETNETEQEVEQHQNVPTEADGTVKDLYGSLTRDQKKEVNRIETRMEKLQREIRQVNAVSKDAQAKKVAKRKRARASRKLNRKR